MKKYILSAAQLWICACTFSVSAASISHLPATPFGETSYPTVQVLPAEKASVKQWKDNKYSMFIHFGVYSSLGGVWQGEPVKRGYSEQIQSFAGIFSDWYAEVANRFNPVHFDAREIVSLAKQAGMRSIVLTSKHHDGFCMFNTQTTDYNSVKSTASKRDFVGELSQACHEAGINFALYFSLIDWHDPHGYPISSHNCDFITPQLHALNLRQVRELLSNYGKISEMWFDMGSLQPSQSKELYQLVKSLQPDCMVSGRLGNDYYDFAVMGDNALPEERLEAPWQSAASMFDETWGYRSWQKRGSVKDKVAEKLRSLINVVAAGGNYLLNIGPDNLGGIVPFEKEVLCQMGDWLKKHGEAIYGCQASPFNKPFAWGNITQKGNSLFLHLSGSYPKDGKIVLPLTGQQCVNSNIEPTRIQQTRQSITLTVNQAAYSNPTDVKVIRLDFDKAIVPTTAHTNKRIQKLLTADNALHEHSYSCFDYNTNYKSTTAFAWEVNKKSVKEIEVYYTDQEKGSAVTIEIDQAPYTVQLEGQETVKPEKPVTLQVQKETFADAWLPGFGSPADWNKFITDKDTKWKTIQAGEITNIPVKPFNNFLLKQTLVADATGTAAVEITTGNGAEVVLNGKVIAKHLNPYRSKDFTEIILLPVHKGTNELVVRSLNRFEETLTLNAKPIDKVQHYKTLLKVESHANGHSHQIRLSRKGLQSPHKDAQLHNITLKIK